MPVRLRLPLPLGLLAAFACFMPLLLGFPAAGGACCCRWPSSRAMRSSARASSTSRATASCSPRSPRCAVLLAVVLAYAARLARSRLPQVLNRVVGWATRCRGR
jgi:iron(III) transport system permease protein